MRGLSRGAALGVSVLLASCGQPGQVASSPFATDSSAQFAYDASAPLDARIEAAESLPGGTIASLSFASPRAGRASGFLALPSGASRAPAVVLVPGSNAPPSAMRATALQLVQRGFAALSIDQSQTRPGHQPLFTFTTADRDEVVATVIDLRRAIDLLAARADIDRLRIGYWGLSHGAFLGGILAGIEKRVGAYVLQSGGGADYLQQNAPRQIADAAALAAYRAAIATVDPNTFIGRAAPASLLFQNGTVDHTYTDSGVAAWVAAASEPKLVRRYAADHLLDASATEDALAFLDRTFATAAAVPRSPLEDARGVLAEQRLTRPAHSYYVSLVATEDSPDVVRDETKDPGFELVVSGAEHLRVDGSPSELRSGHAAAIPSGATRERTGDRPTASYFMSVRPAESRERHLPPHTSILYESADLPATAMPAGEYDDLLVMLVLAPGQVVPPHMHGGIEPTYVIEGTVELRVRGQPIHVLSVGEGDTILPDTPLLITNVSTSVARVLVMLATPHGRSVQTQTGAP